MNNKVFISCAVTGSGDTASKHPDLPKPLNKLQQLQLKLLKQELQLLIFMFEKKTELQVED